MNESVLQHFGYAEMYEFKTKPDHRFGFLVELDDKNTDKIVKATNPNNVIGVTSINYTSLSDNLSFWPNSYYRDEVGETFMDKKIISRGVKQYDQLEEFAFISTKKDEVYIPKEFSQLDKTQKYIQRVDRKEWSPVTLLGKAVVYDYGTCNNDLYCQLYFGIDENKFGTVVPVYDNSLPKYRILKRFSKNTLLILFK